MATGMKFSAATLHELRVELERARQLMYTYMEKAEVEIVTHGTVTREAALNAGRASLAAQAIASIAATIYNSEIVVEEFVPDEPDTVMQIPTDTE